MSTTRVLGAFALLLLGSASAQSLESQLLARLNDLRVAGVRCPTGTKAPAPRLNYSVTLASAAQQQALYMAATGRITHYGENGSTPKVRAASFGEHATSVTEIIFMGSPGPFERAVTWWLNSAVHCNVFTDARYASAGVSVLTGARGTAFVVVFSSNR
ncbi:CAP domain-containing protein [Deinococcus yavapaiensis]|nr:CAP domain-containing protein [Deinococcus yavapaiensis]